MISESLAAQFFRGIARVDATAEQTALYAMQADEPDAIAAIIADEGAQTGRVITFYQVFYNRLPDAGGLDFWTGIARQDAGFTDNALSRAFFDAGEFEALYGELSTEDAVRAIYQNVLGREADPGGLAFWTGLVTDPGNGFGLLELGRSFATAPETDRTFDPLIRDYLGAQARQQEAPETLFDYAKPELETTFTGSDDKVDFASTTLAAAWKGSPVDASGGGITIQNFQSADVLNLDDLRNDPMFQGINGSGYTVAVLDTGIALRHPAFGPVVNGQSSRIVAQVDFTPDNDNTAFDSGNHGSNVSSIIASGNPQYLGVAPEANIAALQVLTGPRGEGSAAWFERALQWVIENAAQYNIVAVNMSLQNGTNTNLAAAEPSGLADEYAKLHELGIITVVAAGNNYYGFQRQAGGAAPGTTTYSADPNVLSVGAVWDESIGSTAAYRDGGKQFRSEPGQVAIFSQRSTGEGIETVFAPGAFVVGAAPGGGTVSQGGTSQAAPQVAGLAVLAQEIAQKFLGRRLTPDEFERLLRESGRTITDVETADDNVVNTGASFRLADAHALARAIVGLGGGGTTPPPTGGGGDVPGGTGTTATVALGMPLTGTLETAGDSDWYRITLNQGTTYRITLDGASSGAGSLTDPFVTLRNANGQVVGRNDDAAGRGRDSLLEIRPEATGTYFVEAKAYSTETGSYRLTVTQPGGGVPDDQRADTGTTGRVAPGTSTTGTLEVQGDRDWYGLDVVAGNSYVIRLSGGTAPGRLSDPILRLRDANGQVIGQNNNANQGTLDSELIHTAERSGRIFVDAGAFGNDKTGQYTIEVSPAMPRMTGDIPGDASTGRTLSVAHGSVTGELEVNGDTDWFGVDLVVGTRYDFALKGAPSGSGTLADPLLRLINPQGVVVASNDDFGDSRESAFSFIPFQTGTFFASAEAFAGEGSGTYRLTVQDQAGALASTGELVAADVTTTASLTEGAPVAGVLDFEGDADWYAVTLAGGTAYSVSMQGLSSGGGDLDDPFLRLYDALGEELTFDDDGGADFDARLSFTPAADGTFYVSAESFGGFSAGTYTLDLVVDASGGAGADTVPDDDTTGASVDVGGSAAGALEYVGDVDWYRTSLVSGEDYEIRIEGASLGGGTLADPVLTVYDINGNQVAFDDDGAGGLDSALVFTPSYTGPYFLAVSGFEGAPVGTFTLSVAGDEAAVVEDGIPGNPGTGLVLDRGLELFDTIDSVIDEDWLRVDLFAGDEVIFSLDPDGASATPLADPLLIVYDASGTPLETADDTEEGLNARLIFVPEEDGHYFVSATSADGGTGDYRLGMAYAEDEGFLAETAVGERFLGAIDFEDDFDWIAVELLAGEVYDIAVFGDAEDSLGIGFGPLEDPVIALFDTRGRFLASDDGGEADAQAGLTGSVEEDGIYFVEIGSASGAAEVAYELLIS